jgi:hypothetical protein
MTSPAVARLLLTAVRAGYGTALLCAPGAALRLCTGQPAGQRERFVARILGIRHLAQAAVTAYAPRPEVLTAGVGIDLCHALSMLVLAAADRTMRAAEVADATAAIALAAVGSTAATAARR